MFLADDSQCLVQEWTHQSFFPLAVPMPVDTGEVAMVVVPVVPAACTCIVSHSRPIVAPFVHGNSYLILVLVDLDVVGMGVQRDTVALLGTLAVGEDTAADPTWERVLRTLTSRHRNLYPLRRISTLNIQM